MMQFTPNRQSSVHYYCTRQTSANKKTSERTFPIWNLFPWFCFRGSSVILLAGKSFEVKYTGQGDIKGKNVWTTSFRSKKCLLYLSFVKHSYYSMTISNNALKLLSTCYSLEELEIQLLPLLAKCPELNPIKYIWGMLGRGVRALELSWLRSRTTSLQTRKIIP